MSAFVSPLAESVSARVAHVIVREITAALLEQLTRAEVDAKFLSNAPFGGLSAANAPVPLKLCGTVFDEKDLIGLAE